jgi:hypothetical protein
MNKGLLKLPPIIRKNIFSEYVSERDNYFLRFEIPDENFVFTRPLKLSENDRTPLIESFCDIFLQLSSNLIGRLKIDTSLELGVVFKSDEKTIDFSFRNYHPMTLSVWVTSSNPKLSGFLISDHGDGKCSCPHCAHCRDIPGVNEEAQQNVKNMIKNIGKKAQIGKITIKSFYGGRSRDSYVIDDVKVSIIKVNPHIKALSKGLLDDNTLFIKQFQSLSPRPWPRQPPRLPSTSSASSSQFSPFSLDFSPASP